MPFTDFVVIDKPTLVVGSPSLHKPNTLHGVAKIFLIFRCREHMPGLITLQEGVEHANWDDKKMSLFTMKSSEHYTTHQNMWQSILNMRFLKHELIKYRYCDTSNSILPASLKPLFMKTKALKLLIGCSFEVSFKIFHPILSQCEFLRRPKIASFLEFFGFIVWYLQKYFSG